LGKSLSTACSSLEEANLYYVCDLSESLLKNIAHTYTSIKTTTNYEDILRDEKVDAVVIAVPAEHHHKLAKEALLSGKHVLVEKPMAANAEEAKELIKVAEQQNKILMVDHTFEYSGAINKMKSIIESGELGDIHYFSAQWLNLGLLQPDVDVMWDLATHIISIISYAGNMRPVSVSAVGKPHVRDKISEMAHLHLRFPQGAVAYITVSWLEPRKTRTLTIVGSKKMLVYDLINDEEPIKIFDKGVDISTDPNDIKQFRINYRYGDIYSPNTKLVEPLRSMCSHFAECIQKNQQPISGGEVGLEVVKILESAENSLKKGGKKIVLQND